MQMYTYIVYSKEIYAYIYGKKCICMAMAQTAKMIMYIYTYFPPSLVVRNAALSHQAAPQRISL